MEALTRLMYGRTSFMIAHRTSTLANCDVLLRIENGRVVTVPNNSFSREERARRNCDESVSLGVRGNLTESYAAKDLNKTMSANF